MRDMTGEARKNSLVTFFYGPLHVDVSVLAYEQELIYISSVRIQDVVWKTCRKCGWYGRMGREIKGNQRELMMNTNNSG